MAEELGFDGKEVFALFQKNNYRAHMHAAIKSNLSEPIVIVFNTIPGASLICTSFFPVKWPDCIHAIFNTSLKYALNTHVSFI